MSFKCHIVCLLCVFFQLNAKAEWQKRHIRSASAPKNTNMSHTKEKQVLGLRCYLYTAHAEHNVFTDWEQPTILYVTFGTIPTQQLMFKMMRSCIHCHINYKKILFSLLFYL